MVCSYGIAHGVALCGFGIAHGARILSAIQFLCINFKNFTNSLPLLSFWGVLEFVFLIFENNVELVSPTFFVCISGFSNLFQSSMGHFAIMH